MEATEVINLIEEEKITLLNATHFNSYFTQNELQNIKNALITNSSVEVIELENINLNNNQLDPYFAAEFGKTFNINRQIQLIDLSNNNLLGLGVTMIARYAEKLDSLITLNLANNNITDIGIYLVEDALKSVGKPDNFYC